MFQKRTKIVLYLIETYFEKRYSIIVKGNKELFQNRTTVRGEQMVELMIIADDFTAALDTGVQFAEKGIPTRVMVSPDDDEKQVDVLSPGQAVVLVIDAETRHVSKEQAYGKVYGIVAEGKKAGIPYIYKKTDSALRGNIGSELEAAFRASKEKFLSFIPAVPQMGRITKNGKQYIDGVLVSESVFGMDPFEPVTKDSVKDIIRLQSQIPVKETSDPQEESWEGEGMIVFDAETDEDMMRIGKSLAASGNGHLLAGCAGFALVLPELLDLKCQTPKEATLEDKLFVMCGSVNPITRRQLDRGEAEGYPRVNLMPEEKLSPKFWSSKEGNRQLEELVKKCRENVCVILDSNDREGMPDTLAYARERGVDTEDVLDEGLQAVILVTGGDTLLGFMKEIGQWELHPLREIRPGCVLTSLSYGGREYHIITKSGGFGDETLLLELTEELKK